MKIQQLKQIESAIGTMTAEEIAAIKKAVYKREGQVEGDVVVRERAASIDRCPRCGSKAIGWGKKNGIPRFKCSNKEIDEAGKKVCGKTFNALTGTPLARLHHADKLIGNAKCMVEGMTVRATAETLGMNKDTAFRWRHRFLELLSKDQPQKLAGIVEVDETYFLESLKGQRTMPPGRKPKKRGTPAKKRGTSTEQIPVLVARERNTAQTLSVVIQSTKASAIGPALVPSLAADAELISDGAKAYKSIARKHAVALRVVPRHKHHKTSGALHINNVNAYDKRLKEWMDRFHGVATKNLHAYLGWHRWLDAAKRSGKTKSMLRAALG